MHSKAIKLARPLVRNIRHKRWGVLNRFELFLCSCFVCCAAYAASKYTRGDCITPTTETYTWFGKYARVEAFSEIEGSSDKFYVLAFPKSVSNDAIFGKEIEQHTKKVDKRFCSY